MRVPQTLTSGHRPSAQFVLFNSSTAGFLITAYISKVMSGKQCFHLHNCFPSKERALGQRGWHISQVVAFPHFSQYSVLISIKSELSTQHSYNVSCCKASAQHHLNSKGDPFFTRCSHFSLQHFEQLQIHYRLIYPSQSPSEPCKCVLLPFLYWQWKQDVEIKGNILSFVFVLGKEPNLFNSGWRWGRKDVGTGLGQTPPIP